MNPASGRWRPRLRAFGQAWLTLLWPPHCAACDQSCNEEDAFCETCSSAIDPIRTACRRCGLPLAASAACCLECLRRPPAYAWARAPFVFGGPMADAIRRLKWHRLPELARPLGRLLVEHLAPGLTDRVVPVPLHPRRLRAREFNQAALLALFARAARGPPVDVQLLERIRDTLPQSQLSGPARQANVRGAFRVSQRADARGQRILLVDDVLTTGATAEACARALFEAGAREVAVLTLARAVP